VAQLKGRHLPQPAVRFLASLRDALSAGGGIAENGAPSAV